MSATMDGRTAVSTGSEGREDGGVLLSVVLDAAELAEVARAWVPHGIPFGFHGSHFS